MFTPHVTLAYLSETLPLQPVARIDWRVRSFRLVHSLLGQGRYHVLGEWPLAD